jgi:hypothetical protein
VTGINWNLLANPAQNFNQALAEGMALGESFRKARDKRDLQEALEAYHANPSDQAAIGTVMKHNPELAMKLSEHADKRAFNTAMGEYLAPGGQPNALLGIGQGSQTLPTAPAPQGQAPVNALGAGVLPPVPQGVSFEEAFAPLAPGANPQSASGQPQQPMQNGQPQPDLSFLGQPQNGRDRAFLAMVQRDPIKALKIQSTMRDNFMGRIEAEADLYSAAVNELSRMGDDAGWQAALQRLAPMAQALGVDLLGAVPPSYPGPEAVQQLLQQALPVKDRLDYLLREANVEADNERADRNTDSLIEDRGARREEQRRINDRRVETTRRGQDLTDSRGRRGQDLTDSRVRSGAGRGSSRAKMPEVSTPAEAAKLPSGTRFKVKGTNIIKVVP